jgi:hypothetical protein
MTYYMMILVRYLTVDEVEKKTAELNKALELLIQAYDDTLEALGNALDLKDSIFTPKGNLPRIHDARHSFAVNALMRWYREGADVGAKLPLLATYMGHVSVVSTHYYLRTATSKRFASHYGELVVPMPGRKGGQE